MKTVITIAFVFLLGVIGAIILFERDKNSAQPSTINNLHSIDHYAKDATYTLLSILKSHRNGTSLVLPEGYTVITNSSVATLLLVSPQITWARDKCHIAVDLQTNVYKLKENEEPQKLFQHSH